MSNWFSRAPVDVPDNVQKRETVLYGPDGEPLVVREPRPVGFRHPRLGVAALREGWDPDALPPEDPTP